MDEAKVRSSWVSMTPWMEKVQLSEEDKQHVISWFQDGFVAKNQTRAQQIPNVFHGEQFEQARVKAARSIFKPFGVLEGTILRTLWHFREEIPGDGSSTSRAEYALQLLDDMVLRNKETVSWRDVERMWRFYECVGLQEDGEVFHDTWNWLNVPTGARESFRDEPVPPAFDVKSQRDAFKKDWRERRVPLFGL